VRTAPPVGVSLQLRPYLRIKQYHKNNGGLNMCKKKIFLIIASCVILFCLTSCDNNSAVIQNDFNFSLNFSTYGRDIIDTYNNTFTKDLVSAGTETIDFVILMDKMNEIYEAFVELKIFDLPDDINAQAQLTMGESITEWEPHNNYILKYTFNGETRTIICNDGGPWCADSGPPDTRERLVQFVKIISDYIYSTEEYNKMSPFEGGYE